MQKNEHIWQLKELIEDRGREAVERALNVHRTTVKRWLDGTVQMPTPMRSHVAMLLGHLPGTDGLWRGWRFWKGELWSPEGYVYRENDVSGIRVDRQRALCDGLVRAKRSTERSGSRDGVGWNACGHIIPFV